MYRFKITRSVLEAKKKQSDKEGVACLAEPETSTINAMWDDEHADLTARCRPSQARFHGGV